MSHKCTIPVTVNYDGSRLDEILENTTTSDRAAIEDVIKDRLQKVLWRTPWIQSFNFDQKPTDDERKVFTATIVTTIGKEIGKPYRSTTLVATSAERLLEAVFDYYAAADVGQHLDKVKFQVQGYQHKQLLTKERFVELCKRDEVILEDDITEIYVNESVLLTD